MPETTVREKGTSSEVPEPTVEEEAEVEEVPWNDRDIDLLAIALQSVGPYFLGNDVRSAESARTVAILVLEGFLAMKYQQPKPSGEFRKEQMQRYMDEQRENKAGNDRRPSSLPDESPTPTEQLANKRRKDDETEDDGKSLAERRADNLRSSGPTSQTSSSSSSSEKDKK